MLAAGYIRVSTEEQVKGDSLKQQQAAVMAYIQAQGWEFAGLYKDEGSSGTIEGRSGFDSMVADARAKKFATMVALKFDRFIRHGGPEFLVLAGELKASGALFVSTAGETTGGDIGSGEWWSGIISTHVAEAEAARIRDRLMAGKRDKRKDGRLYEGPQPYGYEYVKYCHHGPDIRDCRECRGKNQNVARGEFAIIAEQQEVYLRIVEMYLDRNMSIKAISADLKAEGLPMSEPTVNRALHSPIYYGEHYANQYIYEPDPKTGKSRKTNKLKPRSEWIKYQAPPMIDRARWDRIQEKMQRNRSKTKRDSKLQTYWLRDALTCGACKRAGHKSVIKPKTIYMSGKVHRYYRCHHHDASSHWLRSYDRKRCQLKLIKADDLEAAIWQSIKRVLLVGENIDIFADATKWDSHISEQIRQLEQGARTAQRALTGLYRKRDNIDRILDKDLTEEQLERYLAKEQDLDQQIATQKAIAASAAAQVKDIKAGHAQQKELYSYMAQNPQTLAELGARLEELAPEDKKQMIDAMLTGPIVIESNPAGQWRIVNDTKPKRVPVQILRELASDDKLTYSAGKHSMLIKFYEHMAKAA